MAYTDYQSSISICKGIPFDKSYRHVVRFTGVSAQRAYFNSKAIKTMTNCRYTVQGFKLDITVDCVVEDIIECNYVMFSNTNVSTFTYFAFINDMETLSAHSTVLHCEIDVYQTYDHTVKECYVIREMITDGIGVNTTIENLVNDSMYCYGEDIEDDSANSMGVLIAAMPHLVEGITSPTGVVASGIFSGLNYYFITNIKDLQDFLDDYQMLGTTDSIASMTMLPIYFLNGQGGKISSSYSPLHRAFSVQKYQSSVNGYTPKNKKILQYPFNYFIGSNNQGQIQEYKYEHFNDSICMFDYSMDVSPAPTMFVTPKNYLNASMNYDNGLRVSNYPQCAWGSNSFTSWLANTAITVGLGVATGGASTLTMANNILTAPGANLPKGSSSGAGLAAQKKHNVSFKRVMLREEYARKLDSYLTKFGYLSNEVKIPNINNRAYWNYVKTEDVCLIANAPNEAIEKINSIYNSGVTIWHDAANVGNYHLNN